MTAAEPERPDAFSLWMNLIPFVHVAGGAVLLLLLSLGGWRSAGLALAWTYLVPPLLGRLVLLLFGRPAGTYTQDQKGYRVWWVLTQLQTVFNRLPFLEELLRLVPALYPLWIALWGGRLSPFAYVARGVVITDRYLVRVERRAVLGFRSTLAGHMAVRNDAGRWLAVIAAPTVEESAILGGDAGLGPGATLRSGALLPSGRRVGPFDSWPREPAEAREAA
jgi:hypothetical protein